MTTVTIDAPSSVTVNQPVAFTANVTGQNSTKTLNGGVFTVDYGIPYEYSITRKGQAPEVFAASLDENGQPIVTPENPDFLYDANGVLLFDSNSILLQASES